MSTGSDELADYVRQLIERTKGGDIAWSSVSPATYAAVRDTTSGLRRMTLTRALAPPPIVGAGGAIASVFNPLLFQVESLETAGNMGKGVELSIDTREKPELQGVFEDLFAAARSSVNARTARILKELVG